MHKIFVVVLNGVARVCEPTVPADIQVEVIDIDVIRMGESFPSPEAFQYCRGHNIFFERRKDRRAREGDLEKAG